MVYRDRGRTFADLKKCHIEPDDLRAARRLLPHADVVEELKPSPAEDASSIRCDASTAT
jgi:hypothetical protein